MSQHVSIHLSVEHEEGCLAYTLVMKLFSTGLVKSHGFESITVLQLGSRGKIMFMDENRSSSG